MRAACGPHPDGAWEQLRPLARGGLEVHCVRVLTPDEEVPTIEGDVRLLDSELVRSGTHVVWAVGFRDLPSGESRDFLVRSSDDGRHWRRMPTPTALDVPALSFPTPRIGFLSDYSKRLFRTDDSRA